MSSDEIVTPSRVGDAGEGNAQAAEQVVVSALEPATVTQYEWHGAGVVVARGSYDMESVTPLADALDTAASKHPKVVLDASNITFADSTLLNLLLLTHQATALRVVAPQQQLQRLLKLTGVDTILQIRATVEDAAAC